MKRNALKIPIKKIKKRNIASSTKNSVKGFNRHFRLGKPKEYLQKQRRNQKFQDLPSGHIA